MAGSSPSPPKNIRCVCMDSLRLDVVNNSITGDGNLVVVGRYAPMTVVQAVDAIGEALCQRGHRLDAASPGACQLSSKSDIYGSRHNHLAIPYIHHMM